MLPRYALLTGIGTIAYLLTKLLAGLVWLLAAKIVLCLSVSICNICIQIRSRIDSPLFCQMFVVSTIMTGHVA